MLALDAYVEKSFEIWPGLVRLTAAGPDAHAALDAGMDAVRDIAGSLMSDAELLARNSFDVLPRGAAARAVLESARGFAQSLGAAPLPPLLVALPGAICDAVLAAMRSVSQITFASVALGDALAFHIVAPLAPSLIAAMPQVSGEFVAALGAQTGEGGVALAGATRAFPGRGVADLVAAQSASAALASLVATALADAMTWRGARVDRRRIADPLVAQAFSGRDHCIAEGLIPPEDIWETLSRGMKQATALREKRQFQVAAFALKGRGRTLGPVSGDRLLRFGVSEWR